MKFQAVAGLASAAALLPSAYGAVVIRNPTPEELAAEVLAAPLIAFDKRATPQAPDGYTPTEVDCPSTRPTIRNASTLSTNETTWLETRRNNTLSPMKDLLSRLNITGLDTDTYIDNHSSNVSALPNIGIAVSGGGYRALMNGAGAIAAFDSRTRNSTSTGHLGGLLQSATYLAGLSGGGWLVGSLFTNNFTSVQAILDQDTGSDDSGGLWQFGNSIFEGPDTGSIQLLDSIGYYKTLYDEVSAKGDAGYNLTITDYWGRALSFQLVNATNGGPAYTFSSIQDDVAFSQANTPMPILVSDGRAPGQTLITGNATVYEFNPWELGTWDPTTYAFAPLRYLGTNFSAGSVPSGDRCVRGFDNTGFVMGTSSTLFNQFLLEINNQTTLDIPSFVQTALESILTDIGEDEDDIADYPNPFYHFNNDTSRIANDDMLTLVDGGEDLQNIPLHPLIQPERNVDVIFAVDSSADTADPQPAPNWPNGTSLVATYERSLLPISNGTAFPAIPDQNTFVNLGLNSRPTFFGCDSSNMTGQSPIIVYLPNAPYSYNSNFSTFTPSYTDAERNAAINNGYNVATMGNGTVDSDWPTCVGCAILGRSLNRTGTTIPDVCNTCFEKYCWNGTVDSSATNYTPAYALNDTISTTSGAVHLASSSAFALSVALVASLVVLF
ncbi:Lysophospholipase 1 [Zalaria obscura]|uniref:Lysophospholipase 1 n=1 Tax=Zalaria obscura TaxID=2024903 RepID=A0ACC3SL35_9PEZI